MADRVAHPVFARLYPLLAAGSERAGEVPQRERLLAGLAGRVVEIGVGPGQHFSRYPPAVSAVVAVEPEPYLRRLAARQAAVAPVPVEIVAARAERLPLASASADAAVASLVLCSVEDQSAALAELRRVLRPGGELRCFEHVRATTPRMAAFQDVLDPLWRRLAGGCHPGRDTLGALVAAGFEIVEVERFDVPFGKVAVPVSPHIVCRARPA